MPKIPDARNWRLIDPSILGYMAVLISPQFRASGNSGKAFEEGHTKITLYHMTYANGIMPYYGIAIVCCPILDFGICNHYFHAKFRANVIVPWRATGNLRRKVFFCIRRGIVKNWFLGLVKKCQCGAAHNFRLGLIIIRPGRKWWVAYKYIY